MQNIHLTTSEKKICIEFPESVTSSSVGEMMMLFKSFADSDEGQEHPWTELQLIFKQTEMIDSVGLNLIKSMTDWAKSRQIPIATDIHRELIHMILCSVWLDREMTIHTFY